MVRKVSRMLVFLLLGVGGCASGGDRRAENWSAQLREETPGFSLDGRREVALVYSLQNQSKRVRQLDFSTAQHWELLMKDQSGRRLHAWSEDRVFAESPSMVVINPRERLEMRVAVPTRDMVRGGSYRVQVEMLGYPETAAALDLHPR